MLPRVAIVDPELTYDLPPATTAFTGLDALTQNLEAVPVAPRHAADRRHLPRRPHARGAVASRRAWQHGRDAAAREDMAVASLCGGLALANAGLGAVHGLAGPVGGMFRAPHGAVCAALLARVMAANLTAMETRDPANAALPRATEAARLLTGRAGATARDGAEWLATLTGVLGVPGLAAWGVRDEHLPAIAEQAAQSSSMKGNPIALTADELREIVRGACRPGSRPAPRLSGATEAGRDGGHAAPHVQAGLKPCPTTASRCPQRPARAEARPHDNHAAHSVQAGLKPCPTTNHAAPQRPGRAEAAPPHLGHAPPRRRYFVSVKVSNSVPAAVCAR